MWLGADVAIMQRSCSLDVDYILGATCAVRCESNCMFSKEGSSVMAFLVSAFGSLSFRLAGSLALPATSLEQAVGHK